MTQINQEHGINGKSRGDWLDESQANMILVNFQSHFTKAWKKLQKLRGSTMKNTTYHQQAQLITQDVLQAIQ